MPTQRYPAHDPRSWGLPDHLTDPRGVAPVGTWYLDRDGRWQYDPTPADPSPTVIRNAPVIPAHKLGTPRQEMVMTSLEPDRPSYDYGQPIPPSPDVYDPSIGSDGGGQHIDSDPASFEQPVGFERPGGVSGPDIAVCDRCGSVVGRDRLR